MGRVGALVLAAALLAAGCKKDGGGGARASAADAGAKATARPNERRLAALKLGVGLEKASTSIWMAFSRDGKHAAYRGSNVVQDGWPLVIDDVSITSAPFARGGVAFDPAGRKLAVAAFRSERGPGGDRTFIAIVDVENPSAPPARAGDSFESAEDPFFAPDGRLGFVARVGVGRVRYVLGDQPLREYAKVRMPRFSADGKHFAYVGKDALGYDHAVVDEKEGPPYIDIDNLALGPTGTPAVYSEGATFGDKHAVVDGVAGPGFSWVQDVAVSADGKHIAYRASIGPIGASKYTLVLDGNVLFPAEPNALSGPALSPTGTLVHARERAGAGKITGSWALLVDGKERFALPHGPRRIVVSPGAEHVAWTEGDSAPVAVVVDGKRTEGFDWVDPMRFDEAKKAFVFPAKRGLELVWVELPVGP